MRKTFIALSAAVAVALMAAPTMARDLSLGIGFGQGSLGVGGVSGATLDNSGTLSGVKTIKNGGATAGASAEGFGKAESTFQGEYKAGGVGPLSLSTWGMQGKSLSESGSLSQSAVTSTGNGSGSASAGNASFANGSSIGIGGAGTLGGAGIGLSAR